MILRHPLRYSYCAFLAFGLSGCLGAFEHQPPRYNFVSGAKHAPILNPGGSRYTPEVNKMNADQAAGNEAQQIAPDAAAAAMQADRAAPASGPAAAGNMAPTAQAGGAVSGAPEPSPLYYYEQQQSKVAAADLPPAAVNPAAPVTASGVTGNQAIPATENPAVMPSAQATEFPALQGVPQKASPGLQKNFDSAKQKAAAFEAANPAPPPSVDLTKQPLDITTQPVATPAPGVSPAPQEAVLSDMPLDQATESTPPAIAAAPAPSPMATMTPIEPPAPLPRTPPSSALSGDAMIPVSPPPPAPVFAPSVPAQEPAVNALAPTPVAPPMPGAFPPSNPADTMVTVPTPASVAATPFVSQAEPIHLIAPNTASSHLREIPPSRYSRLRAHTGLSARSLNE